MKIFLVVFVLAFALAMQAQPQTNVPTAIASTNALPPHLAIRPAPVSVTVGNSMPTNATLVVLDDEARTLLRHATDEPFIKTDTLVNALLTAVLAVGVGLFADWLREKRDKARKQTEDEEFERNTVLAIRRELETMGGIYDAGIGMSLRITEGGPFFTVRLALTQDWFTIFSANAAHLGRIDADISHRIIACYALLKALIEEFRINNDYLATLAEIERELVLSGDWAAEVKRGSTISQKKAHIHTILVAQFARIQNSEQTLKTAVKELFEVLDKGGIK